MTARMSSLIGLALYIGSGVTIALISQFISHTWISGWIAGVFAIVTGNAIQKAFRE